MGKPFRGEKICTKKDKFVPYEIFADYPIQNPFRCPWILGILFVPHILKVSVAQFGTDHLTISNNTALVIESTSLLKNEDPNCLNYCSVSSIDQVSIDYLTMNITLQK